MSALNDAIDDFGDPDRSPRARGMSRVAHALPWVLAGWGGFCALEWLEVLRVEEWGPLGLLSIVPFLVTVLAAQWHQELARLCLTCMTSVPADAPVRAQRYRRLLWLNHWLAPMWRYFLVVGIGTGLTFAVRAVFDWDTSSTTWLRAPVDLLVLTYLWSQWRHHQYRPWCPYCRRWDDGDGMREPSPDSTSSGTKTLA